MTYEHMIYSYRDICYLKKKTVEKTKKCILFRLDVKGPGYIQEIPNRPQTQRRFTLYQSGFRSYRFTHEFKVGL